MQQSALFALSILFVAATSIQHLANGADADAVRDALAKHEVAVSNFSAWPELSPSGGTAFLDDAAVYVALDSWPADGKLHIPRLNNPTTKIHMLGKPDAELAIWPEVKHWIVTLPEEASQSTEAIVVIPTIGRPHLPMRPDPVQPNDQGLLRLPAHEAITHGEKLRYEPQPHKNTVGYWTNPTDYAQWVIQVTAAGQYDVHILQGCGKGQGGSDVKLQVRPLGADSAASGRPAAVGFVVKETGHFQNFVRRKVGSLSLEPGVHSVEIRPVRLANKAVMDVREVRLVPR